MRAAPKRISSRLRNHKSFDRTASSRSASLPALASLQSRVDYTRNEAKRESNLEKHGFDFADAALVYEHPGKVTLDMERHGEQRKQDLALVQVKGKILALAYVKRSGQIRCISFRRADKGDRNL